MHFNAQNESQNTYTGLNCDRNGFILMVVNE